MNSLTTSFRSRCCSAPVSLPVFLLMRHRSREPPDFISRLCLLCHGDDILCAVSGHHWHLAASILCGGDLMAGCVAFLPVCTDFANGGDEVPLFAPCRSRRGGHCGGCFSRPRFRPILFCFRTVFAHGRRDHVSLGISYTKRQLVPKKRLFYDHLRYVAGVVIFGF